MPARKTFPMRASQVISCLLLLALHGAVVGQVLANGAPGPVIVRKNVTTAPVKTPATRPVAKKAPKPETLAGCRALYMSGKYKEAAAAYKTLLSDRSLRVSAAIGLADALSMTGQYAGAVETLESVVDTGADRADWRLAMAEALSSIGRYEKALAHAVKANELRPFWAPTILTRGRLLETLGRDDQAAKVYQTMSEVIDRDKYRNDARSLVALGGILDRDSVLSSRKASEQASNILHNYLQEAYRKVDKKYWPAHIAAGMFLLDKHQSAQAMKEFSRALKLNKRIPDAFVGAGVVELGKWRFEKCLKNVAQALKINPNHPEAILLKATCLMQWRKFGEVPPLLDKILKVNPNHLGALSLMAAVHIRTDNPDKAEPYAARIGKVNGRYYGLSNTIAQWLAAGRQFDKAEKYYLEAIKLAPKRAEPLTGLGRLYMQTGDEKKARRILVQARALDDFRADVLNYLKILRRLDDFEIRETEHFIVKIDPKHDAVLLGQVSDYMERIYPEVCAAYDHEPPFKTIIEIFPTQEQFSQRISGKGWVGTVGACTGRVIALAAPRTSAETPLGTHNWATVLRHEFTHAVTLSATKNRIPHWFTEACAVFQQPDKQNFRYIAMLVKATRANRLFTVQEMDWSFIRPKRRGDRALAYAQAAWTMEYIIETKKYKTIIDMLKGFRDGLTQAEVFEKIVGAKEADFNKNFRVWARLKVREWGYDSEPAPNLAKAAEAAKKNPKDADAQATYALALFARGKRFFKRATEAAGKALAIDKNNKTALKVMAGYYLKEKKYDQAVAFANRLEKADRKNSVAPRILAQSHIAKRKWTSAIEALELLKRRQRMDSFSYEQLAKIYQQLGQPEKALPNLIYLHRHTSRDHKYARQIAEIYRDMDRPDDALVYFRQITHINPYEASAYHQIASIHLQAQRYDEAVAAIERFVLLEPKSSTSWAYMAMIRYRAGTARSDREELLKAKAAVDKALELDPSDSRAEHIGKMIESSLAELGATNE